ncbi:hypothetical protein RvY_14506 [Ramazzottius varieornatus]|uniref:Uncharacterized protein n=1 Tax=Ramazzottius varieornatus TaxID=947166 RepID=A0A1D1VYW4_RAMVA|nr:hypothetical protein RvY_14506 [Ramazzottius varieornatus]
MELDVLKDSVSKRKVDFEVFAAEPVNAFQLNANRDGGPSPTFGRDRMRKELRVPVHEHELIVLTPIVKKRLHRIIRRLQNKPYRLHLKRQYRRQARERKLERRAEIVRKQKAAEKAAAKGGKGTKDGEGAGRPTTPTKGKSPDKPSGKGSEKRYKPQHRVQKWRENRYRKWKNIKLRARFTKHELRERQFDEKHPATRPFVQSCFGVAPQEKEVRMSRELRTSERWGGVMDAQTQGQFRPVPRVNPYQEPRRKQTDAVAKRRLRHALKKEWEVSNHDRLQRDQLVKAMSRLIIQAKEQYDNEVRK